MRTSRLGFASILSVIAFSLLVLGLAAGVYVSQKGVSLPTRASDLEFEVDRQASIADRKGGVVHNPRVLFITLNQHEGKKDMASTYYGWLWSGKNLQKIEAKIPKLSAKYYNKLTEGRVNFEVVKTIKLKNSPTYTNGYRFTIDDYDHCIHGGVLSNGLTCEEQKHLFDHNAFLSENNVCQIVNDNKIDEVWLLSNPFVTTWEAWMVGPTRGFGPNGGVYVDPKCGKQVVVMSMVYNSVTAMGHVFGHRIEATMNYLSANWDESERRKYIENFMNLARYATNYGVDQPQYPGPGCGNSHFPLNGLKHYDYGQKEMRDFNCADWSNFPNFTGKTEKIGCDKWRCSNEGWNAYWQAAMPHSTGKVKVNLIDGQQLALKRDWWFYILYPDNAIAFREKSEPKGVTLQQAAKPLKIVTD